jgi:hypothetical protein
MWRSKSRHPATLLIDENWCISPTARGPELIDKIAHLIRRFYVSLK